MANEIPNYTIRPMRRDEIPDVLELWRDTGLSEGTHSLDTWYSHDPEGFFVAVTDDGTVIGACAGVLQNEDLAFVGLYVVKDNYRRRGIGMKIWSAVMERIGDRNVGVNPVPEQLENYRDKSGFPVQTSWSSKVSAAETVDTTKLSHDLPEIAVRELSSGNVDLVDKVVAYDADVCSFTRGDLVPLLCDQEDSVTMVALRDGEVCGYGNIKKNIKGNTIIGPLYADCGEIAEKILDELVNAFPLAREEGALIFTVDNNGSAMEILEKLGFETDCVISRLYRKEEVDVKFDKIFAQYNLNFSIF
ncbi:hypothetical protein JTE90_008222 [Oedothorax gibbosus]|uniref:N-acetyltransferase domain-containing protein n=1 Tax=Oedothorax gibbosus TaxID=931172 RepID=A0AAV6TZ13_9ARAC|nr:hypothetical protein JTE90_008222 [Oedothorax gibbosus]